MTPDQISQALKVRMLRADAAERALRRARLAEGQASAALNSVRSDLAQFDDAFESRIRAFTERSSLGISAGSLHSARSFHADLAGERTGLLALISEAEGVLDQLRRRVAEARTAWNEATVAASNLREMHGKAVADSLRQNERRAEQDLDDLSVMRAHRGRGGVVRC